MCVLWLKANIIFPHYCTGIQEYVNETRQINEKMPITTVHSTLLISCGKGNFDSSNRLFRDFASLAVDFLSYNPMVWAMVSI